jgi:hypothetical protein
VGASPRDSAGEVLFALAVGGDAGPARIASTSGLPEPSVREVLGALRGAGRVAPAARPGEWSLTAAGRVAAAAAIERERADLGADVSSRHPRLAALDAALKEAITRWQIRNVGGVDVPNDHRDPGHDAAVVEDLGELARAAVVWLAPLAERRARYRRYGERIEAAVARVRAGEAGWIAGLGVDSLHSIWWQLHSDLLAVLGRPRGSSEA